MKCRRCKHQAVVDLKSHNTAFCQDCFFLYMGRQVKRAISEHRMLKPGDRILVCVSGGKDSLVLWEILSGLDYQVHGLYIDLGIDGYSARSKEKVERFARDRSLESTVISLPERGIPIPALARRNRRSGCSVCGTVKRHFFNRVAVERGFDVVATGHNLDDEAGRLLGNLLHWQWAYLVKQSPVLPAVSGGMLVKKAEPLCRLAERETAAYAVLRGIDYILEECPMSHGASSNHYKQVLNLLEDWMPGTKANFYGGFLKSAPLFQERAPAFVQAEESTPCSGCGFPSYLDPCTFCRLTNNGTRG